MEGNKSFDWARYAGDRWSPEEVGDEIVGTVVGLRPEEGRSGPLPVLTLDTHASGEMEVWAGQVHLQQQLAKHAPEIGDHVTITLVELRNTGMPSPMKVFDVVVDHAGGDGESSEPF